MQQMHNGGGKKNIKKKERKIPGSQSKITNKGFDPGRPATVVANKRGSDEGQRNRRGKDVGRGASHSPLPDGVKKEEFQPQRKKKSKAELANAEAVKKGDALWGGGAREARGNGYPHHYRKEQLSWVFWGFP